jgi:hypothetical protein
VSLYINSNRLYGSIPVELASLNLLQQLDLANNSLTGSLPSAFIGASELIMLNLAHNDLSGDLNAIFTQDAPVQFPLLQMVALSSNAFT